MEQAIVVADLRENRNLKTASRAVLFTLASAKSNGSHIVKLYHTEARGQQMKPFFRSLLREGQIRLFIEGTRLGDESDAGSLYLRANFADATSNPAFWEKSPTVTVLCV